MALTTSVLHDGDVAVIALSGELDLAGIDLVDRTVSSVLEDGLRTVVLDLDALVFCDSTGVGALLRAARRVRAAGGSFAAGGACPQVRRVLDLMVVAEHLGLADDVQQVLLTLTPVPRDAPGS